MGKTVDIVDECSSCALDTHGCGSCSFDDSIGEDVASDEVAGNVAELGLGSLDLWGYCGIVYVVPKGVSADIEVVLEP